MKLKLMLMSSFCFFLVSCGGGGGGDVYDEYHDLVCKSANAVSNMSMDEAMDVAEEATAFAIKNAGKMTDETKLANALDVTRC